MNGPSARREQAVVRRNDQRIVHLGDAVGHSPTIGRSFPPARFTILRHDLSSSEWCTPAIRSSSGETAIGRWTSARGTDVAADAM
jgi:hypothetical protein